MHPRHLIDAVVQQTTVLIAQLSTSEGVRAPLARISDQIFVNLARELESQGVARKVAADMFGLALRTYFAKVRRLESSVGDKNKTLWESVLKYVEDHEDCDRKELLQRFEEDDPLNIGAILKDLCDSGLLHRSGPITSGRYRVASTSENGGAQSIPSTEALAALVRVAVYRGVTSKSALARQLGVEPGLLESSLDLLIADGKLHVADTGELCTEGASIPPGAPVGWEAAFLDHYQAVVGALSGKLARGSTRSEHDDATGGGTVSFVLSPGHPLRDEVHALLKSVRAEVDELWKKAGEEQKKLKAAGASEADAEVVTFYFGQSIKENRS